jgi:hypothetical protein
MQSLGFEKSRRCTGADSEPNYLVFEKRNDSRVTLSSSRNARKVDGNFSSLYGMHHLSNHPQTVVDRDLKKLAI